ncbi:hypothetical protein KQI65_08810 [bacterium]|nr:hypothetical protein [bacterium]
MKRILSLAALFAFALTLTVINTQDTYAQGKPDGKGFVDANGDGYNDNAMDDDGDGIPNGRDEDYTGTVSGRGFVDADGDGINDNAPDADGDGIPNGQDPDYVPGSGTGNVGERGMRGGNAGEGSGTGTGECDETGPKGNGRRGK